MGKRLIRIDCSADCRHVTMRPSDTVCHSVQAFKDHKANIRVLYAQLHTLNNVFVDAWMKSNTFHISPDHRSFNIYGKELQAFLFLR